jgi:putative FmdB family regulatory protein
MPLYEYKCQSCGEVFEIIQKFSDTPLTVHEKCGGQVERLISTSALMFKGSGWYVNDYGKGNSKDPKPKSADSNGESKPATNKETSSSSDSSSKTESSSAKSDTASKTESSPAKSSPSKSDSK